MIFSPGDHVLVAHRRLFAEDQPRFFVGRVEEWQAGMVAATGYAWLRDPVAGGFQRKEDMRTKVFAITSGAIIVYRLPKELALEKLRLERVGEHGLYLVDDSHYRMDLAERMAHRAPSPKAG
jgi:hypothetical protein